MSCAHMGSLTSSSSKDLDSMIFLSRFSSSARISAISPSAAWHEVTHCRSQRSYRHFLLGRSRPLTVPDCLIRGRLGNGSSIGLRPRSSHSIFVGIAGFCLKAKHSFQKFLNLFATRPRKKKHVAIKNTRITDMPVIRATFVEFRQHSSTSSIIWQKLGKLPYKNFGRI